MLLIRSLDARQTNSIFQKERLLTFDLKSKLMMHVLNFFNVFFMFSKLQMAASHGPVSRKKQLLEEEIEYKQKSLIGYKEYVKPSKNEIICVLEAKKSKKEAELKNCYWIQCMATKKFLLSVDLNLIKIFFVVDILHNKI